VRPDWASVERAARFMTALIHASVMSVVRGGYAGGPGTKAIFDEAGSFMRLDRLGSYLDLARGGKMGVVYVLQSRAQLRRQLSSEEAERVWSATELQIAGPTSDLQLARDIATLLARSASTTPGPPPR
jgi:type IV secretory pathway TraG/TraD family ATPase VirD4